MANLKYLRPSIPQNSPKLSLPFPSLTLLTALQNCGYWSMIAIAQAILYYNSIVFYAINSQYGHLKLNIFFLPPCHSQRGSRTNLFSFLYGWRQCQWPLVLTHVHLTHESMPLFPQNAFWPYIWGLSWNDKLTFYVLLSFFSCSGAGVHTHTFV